MRLRSRTRGSALESAVGAAIPMLASLGLLGGFEDGLGAPGEAVDLALAARAMRARWASCLSKAASMPRRTASSGTPASRQVSMRAQSSVESMRMEPRRCWKRVLDLGEVVEVVHSAIRCQTAGVEFTPLSKDPMILKGNGLFYYLFYDPDSIGFGLKRF